MKHELKIEYKDTKTFSTFIESSYKDGNLVDRNNKMIFTKGSTIHTLCQGLSNHIIRLTNDELIDGSLRLSIQEEGEVVALYPCSIVYEMDLNKYSFLI